MSSVQARYAAFLFIDAGLSVLRALAQLWVISAQFDRSWIGRVCVASETLLLLIGPVAAVLICRGKAIGWKVGIAALLLVGASIVLQMEWDSHCELLFRKKHPLIPRPVNNELGEEFLSLIGRVGWAVCYACVLFGVRRTPFSDRPAAESVSPGELRLLR
ncbi:MAG: hypothetical protein HY290_25885 [Planctomycetia bacterium]|nr:hypothetical protein [Planctomycetia bacterium]